MSLLKTKADDPTDAIFGIAPDSTIIHHPVSKGPHFLVAGTTGSGKSVFINSLLISAMSHSHPDELKLAIIDPKTVEFTAYKDLPYMLANPITDLKQANDFVLYLTIEMDRRYTLLAENGVKNLEEYRELREKNKDLEDLPYIMLVIDEFSDLIGQYKEVEKPIVRIGQKARAAGIHMIIATQSPRREVITGLIKANVPSRVSLMVASSTESSIILDETGGEKLRPRGDFLLKMNGGQATRGQAPFISNGEIAEIFEDMRERYDEPEFVDFQSVVHNSDSGEEEKPKMRDRVNKFHKKDADDTAIRNDKAPKIDIPETTNKRKTKKEMTEDDRKVLQDKKEALRQKQRMSQKKRKKQPKRVSVDTSRFAKDRKGRKNTPSKSRTERPVSTNVESKANVQQDVKSTPVRQNKTSDTKIKQPVSKERPTMQSTSTPSRPKSTPSRSKPTSNRPKPTSNSPKPTSNSPNNFKPKQKQSRNVGR